MEKKYINYLDGIYAIVRDLAAARAVHPNFATLEELLRLSGWELDSYKFAKFYNKKINEQNWSLWVGDNELAPLGKPYFLDDYIDYYSDEEYTNKLNEWCAVQQQLAQYFQQKDPTIQFIKTGTFLTKDEDFPTLNYTYFKYDFFFIGIQQTYLGEWHMPGVGSVICCNVPEHKLPRAIYQFADN